MRTVTGSQIYTYGMSFLCHREICQTHAGLEGWRDAERAPAVQTGDWCRQTVDESSISKICFYIDHARTVDKLQKMRSHFYVISKYNIMLKNV